MIAEWWPGPAAAALIACGGYSLLFLRGVSRDLGRSMLDGSTVFALWTVLLSIALALGVVWIVGTIAA